MDTRRVGQFEPRSPRHPDVHYGRLLGRDRRGDYFNSVTIRGITVTVGETRSGKVSPRDRKEIDIGLPFNGKLDVIQSGYPTGATAQVTVAAICRRPLLGGRSHHRIEIDLLLVTEDCPAPTARKSYPFSLVPAPEPTRPSEDAVVGNDLRTLYTDGRRLRAIQMGQLIQGRGGLDPVKNLAEEWAEKASTAVREYNEQVRAANSAREKGKPDIEREEVLKAQYDFYFKLAATLNLIQVELNSDMSAVAVQRVSD